MSECTHGENDLPDDWPPKQRKLFNRVYRHMLLNQRGFLHPQAPMVDDELWSTTAWNAAWFAAHASVSDEPLEIFNENFELDLEATEAPPAQEH